MRASRASPSALTDGVPEDAAARSEEQQAPHGSSPSCSPGIGARAKVAYWDFFHRMGMDRPELTADKDALGPLELVGPVGEPFMPTPRSKFFASAGAIGSRRRTTTSGRARSSTTPEATAPLRTASSGAAWKVPAENVDRRRGRVSRRVRPGRRGVDAEHPEVLVPLDIFGDREQRAALLAPRRMGRGDTASTPPGACRAARDLLLARPPSMRPGRPGAAFAATARPELDAARRLVVARWTQSALAIQGPPGSGKTYTGARMIVRLLAAGKARRDHGQQPQGHRQLAREVLVAASEGRRRPAGPEGHRADGALDDPRRHRRDEERQGAGRAVDRYAQRRGRNALALGAGGERRRSSTCCSLTRPARWRLRTSLAVSRERRDSIVLLGDPQQLDQPLQGSHPPGADRSALAHILGGHDAMPEHARPLPRAHLAPSSGRDAFTSSAFYEGKLESRPEPGAVSASSARSRCAATGVRLLEASSTSVPTASRRRRRGRSPRSFARWSRADRRGSTPGRRRARDRVRGRPRRRAVQRPGRRDRSARSRPMRGSARSTSSRGRRRRSASTR